MGRKYRAREVAWVVLRYDEYQEPAPPETTITVKEVVRSEELAKAEVERLNRLNAGKECRYWYVGTRLFPEGTSAGTDFGGDEV